MASVDTGSFDPFKNTLRMENPQREQLFRSGAVWQTAPLTTPAQLAIADAA